MSAQSLHRSATALLEAWRPRARPDESVRQAVLAFLGAAPDACLRANASGHITASAVVFSHDGSEVLLTLHPRVGRWIQLGGHCEEADDSVLDAALREATEESGIDGLRIAPELFGVQVHPITCSLGVPTRHLDLTFRLTAPEAAAPTRSPESLDLRWWDVNQLPANTDVLLTQR